MDGNQTTVQVTCQATVSCPWIQGHLLCPTVCHPWTLDSGIPDRNDGPPTLVYNGEYSRLGMVFLKLQLSIAQPSSTARKEKESPTQRRNVKSRSTLVNPGYDQRSPGFSLAKRLHSGYSLHVCVTSVGYFNFANLAHPPGSLHIHLDLMHTHPRTGML